MTEETTKPPLIKSSIIVVIIVVCVVSGVLIAIPIVYAKGRNRGGGQTTVILNIPTTDIDYVTNECTQLSPTSKIEPIRYLSDEEPFPYKYFSNLYRPSVIKKEITLMFGFRHDNKSWSLDKISVFDVQGNKEIFSDGDFESNYLTKNYAQCILSSTRSSVSDIYFDLPYTNDFYYNDQTNVGMTYLTQSFPIIGGRYYNISFYLENRGYKNNSFILIVQS